MSGERATEPAAPRRRFATLPEVRAAEDGVVVLEDWGGQVLVAARAETVSCDEAALGWLLSDLDAYAWPCNDRQGARIYFMRGAIETGVWGGMGGGSVTEDVWVHAALVQAGLESGVRAVLAGQLSRLPEPDPPVSRHERERILRAYRRRLPASGIHFGWGWPEGWSTVHRDELERRKDEEIPRRADGERWYSATIRAVVRHAGLAPWVPCPRPPSSLAEARSADRRLVALTVAWGGLHLVSAGLPCVGCDEPTLGRLLADLHTLTRPGDAPHGARIAFPHGGGRFLEAVDVAPVLVQAGLEPGVRAVIAGERPRLPEVDPPVEPHERDSILRAYREQLPGCGNHFGWGRPHAWSALSEDELRRRVDEEIPPRTDGERWYGTTLRAVVRHAGLDAWVPRRDEP